EVALARAERAVKERPVAAAFLQSSLDEVERLAEVVCELRGDDVLGECLLGLAHPFGELEHVVVRAHRLRDDDGVTQRCRGAHRVVLLIAVVGGVTLATGSGSAAGAWSPGGEVVAREAVLLELLFQEGGEVASGAASEVGMDVGVP